MTEIITAPALRNAAKTTKSNEIPVSYDGVLAVSLRFIGGLSLHEKSIGFKQTTERILRQALEGAQTKQQAYQAARGERAQSLTPARQEVDQKTRDFINDTKKVLRHHLGDQWNQGWLEPGFVDPSIQTPETLSGRQTLLQALAAYFKAHPEHESTEFNVTAVRATDLYRTMSEAQDAVQDHASRRAVLKAERDEAVAALRKRLRAGIAELALLIDRDSPLWAAFGLTAPAQQGIRKKNTQVGESEGSSAMEGNAGSLQAEDSKVIPMAA